MPQLDTASFLQIALFVFVVYFILYIFFELFFTYSISTITIATYKKIAVARLLNISVKINKQLNYFPIISLKIFYSIFNGIDVPINFTY